MTLPQPHPRVARNAARIIEELISVAEIFEYLEETPLDTTGKGFLESFPLMIEKVFDDARNEKWHSEYVHKELVQIRDRAVNIIVRVFGKSSNYKKRLKSFFKESSSTSELLEERDKFVLLLTHLLDEIKLVRTSLEESSMSKTQIILGDGTIIHGDFVVANSIKESFNKAKSAKIPSELQEALIALTKEVAKLIEALPNEVALQVTRDLEVLTAEATSTTPRVQWLQLSADGLKRAAINLGEIGKPVLELAARILPLLKFREEKAG